MTVSRILGIDYGLSRVGYAISDPSGIIATGIESYKRKSKSDMSEVINRTVELIRQYQAQEVVIGKALRTDGGTPGTVFKESQELASAIKEETGIDPVFFDERFTSRIAHNIMNATNVKKQNKKSMVDKIAAEIILQDYLEFKRPI